MIHSSSLSPVQSALHALNRLAFGPTSGDVDYVKQIGVENWIESQLHPDSIPEPPALQRLVASLPTLHLTAEELFVRYQLPLGQLSGAEKKAARNNSRRIVQEAVQARIVRALDSPCQLQEVLTAFWFNHFNIFEGKGLCHLWLGSFEQEAIRPHTMGRFRELLGATAKHPAMLFYLDNWQNTAPNSPGAHGRFDGINENYARELMELHTLGVNGGYSQADVIALAHILTGWGLSRPGGPTLANPPGLEAARGKQMGLLLRHLGFRLWRTYSHARRMNDQLERGNGFQFYPRRHDFSPQTLLGQDLPAGGLEQGEAALDMLARSSSTANHLSYQLAQYFVADDPPARLVERMARRYQATDGDLREVLRSLFFSSEFWDRRHYGVKFKTPYEFVVSLTRAAGVGVVNTRPLAGAMTTMGMPLYGCQTPDGYRQTRDAWLSPDAMMVRLNFATALGAGHLPLQLPMDEFLPADSPSKFEATIQPAPIGTLRPWDLSVVPNPASIAACVSDQLSSRTRDAIAAAPSRLHSALILGSPEFMMR
jgi:uncharacterized protein (DUF1800 family)